MFKVINEIQDYCDIRIPDARGIIQKEIIWKLLVRPYSISLWRFDFYQTNTKKNMMSFVHESHITILGYAMIGLQEWRHIKRLAQTTKGYSIFKNLISSVKLI